MVPNRPIFNYVVFRENCGNFYKNKLYSFCHTLHLEIIIFDACIPQFFCIENIGFSITFCELPQSCFRSVSNSNQQTYMLNSFHRETCRHSSYFLLQIEFCFSALCHCVWHAFVIMFE